MKIEEKIEIVNSKLNNEIKKNIVIFANDEKDYVAVRLYFVLKRFYSVRMVFGKANEFKFDYLDYDNSDVVKAYFTINSFDVVIITSELFYNNQLNNVDALIDLLSHRNVYFLYINVFDYFRLENDVLTQYNESEIGRQFRNKICELDQTKCIDVAAVVGNNDLSEDNDLIQAIIECCEIEKAVNITKKTEICLTDDIAKHIILLLQNKVSEISDYYYYTCISDLSVMISNINNYMVNDEKWNQTLFELVKKILNQKSCVFKLIYMLKPKECYLGNKVAASRVCLGEQLSEAIPQEVIEQIDMVVPVPKTGVYYAMGVAKKIQKPYIQALIKDTTDIRTFQIFDINVRKEIIREKVVPIPELLNDKNVLLVDEAIFTGTTLKEVCKMVRKCGAKSIYIAIPSPSCYNQCRYGMQPERVMLLEYYRKDNLKTYFDVDGVYYQNDITFKTFINNESVCMECFLD